MGCLPTTSPDLERLYGVALGFEAPCLYVNFVSSLDGVVALKGLEHSSKLISGRSEPIGSSWGCSQRSPTRS